MFVIIRTYKLKNCVLVRGKDSNSSMLSQAPCKTNCSMSNDSNLCLHMNHEPRHKCHFSAVNVSQAQTLQQSPGWAIFRLKCSGFVSSLSVTNAESRTLVPSSWVRGCTAFFVGRAALPCEIELGFLVCSADDPGPSSYAHTSKRCVRAFLVMSDLLLGVLGLMALTLVLTQPSLE